MALQLEIIRQLRRTVLFVSVTLVCFLPSGCGVRIPVKAAPVIEGVGGKGTTADLTTIHPGTSTREEILRNWGWSDTHVNSDRIFVGQVRASTSRSSIVLIAPIPIPYAGTYRDWAVHFLIVEFDDRGTVSNDELIETGQLGHRMIAWLGRVPQPALDLHHSIQLKSSVEFTEPPPVLHRALFFKGGLSLQSDGLELRSEDSNPAPVHLALEQLHKLHGCGIYLPEGSTDVQNFYCLDVSGTPRARSRLSIALSSSDLLTFIRYLMQVAPSTIESNR